MRTPNRTDSSGLAAGRAKTRCGFRSVVFSPLKRPSDEGVGTLSWHRRMGRKFVGSAFAGLVMAVSFFAASLDAVAAVPLTLHFQGHIGAEGTPVDGQGEFKFALVDPAGEDTWSNAPILEGEDQPSAAVSVLVDQGFYTVQLGDDTLPNMAPLTLEAIRVEGIVLRIWFNDGQATFEQLTPDHPISSAAFAVSAHHAEVADVASSVSEGAVGLEQLSEEFAAQFAELNEKVLELETLREGIEAGLQTMATVSIDPEDPTLVENGFVRFTSFAEGKWVNGSGIGQPLARTHHSAVWTGNEMIVWGGTLPGALTGDGAAIYRPDLDQWTPLSPINVLSDRRRHSAVWTGEEMIVWGGFGFPGYLGDGSRFNPSTQTWRTTSPLGAPQARERHGAVWNGTGMIVWGGRNGGGLLADGGIYDPATDTWTVLPTTDAPSARFEHGMVWAGDRLIVWGGRGANGQPLNDGAQLLFTNGVPDQWYPISGIDAPAARSRHSAVWAGTVLLIWGGQGSGLLNDGAAYDPAADVWTPLPSTDVPTPRAFHNTLWSGTEMLIFGGSTASGPTETAHALDPLAGTWRELSSVGGPIARAEASAVWTGEEMMIFGGQRNGIALNALQRLSPRPALHLFRIP